MSGPTDKEGVSEWVRAVETLSNVHYRVWKTYKCKKEGAYKVGETIRKHFRSMLCCMAYCLWIFLTEQFISNIHGSLYNCAFNWKLRSEKLAREYFNI